MNINFIYNLNGKPEYAVIPYNIWETLEKYISGNESNIQKKIKKRFNPDNYKGILSHLHLNVDKEIKKMRSEWKRDF